MKSGYFIKLERGKSKAFVIINPKKSSVLPCAEKLIGELRKCEIKPFMDTFAEKLIKSEGVSYVEREEGFRESDIVFVVGGDGTILRAAKGAILYDKPILGINAGRLGFLSDLEESDLENVEKLVNEGCPVEKRMVLDIEKGNESVLAINDVYLTKTQPGRTTELFVECNGREVCRYRADGIVMATPDGSTAYSMSAGGPVLDTTLNAIIMTPVCPHSLISRSIVFSPDKTISVGSEFSGGERKLDVVVDGEIVFCIKKNEKITVRASEKCARFVNISGRGFYEVLNQKIIGRR